MKHLTDEYLQAARLQAIELFPIESCNSEIARQVGVARSTIVRWRHQWEKHGAAGLSLSKRGAKSRLTDEQWQEITQLLLLGPKECGYDTELWTLPRIADLIRKTTGVSYNPGYVWELLRNLGWSCQKPQTLAKERDEEAVQRWIREDWPMIKRGPRSVAPD